ncbi:MAG: hypothetical protein AAYR33_01345 [Acetobacteraceae bacterium]
MLDWEAPTGGYLLQAYFSTDYLAALSAEKWHDSTCGLRYRCVYECGNFPGAGPGWTRCPAQPAGTSGDATAGAGQFRFR